MLGWIKDGIKEQINTSCFCIERAFHIWDWPNCKRLRSHRFDRHLSRATLLPATSRAPNSSEPHRSPSTTSLGSAGSVAHPKPASHDQSQLGTHWNCEQRKFNRCTEHRSSNFAKKRMASKQGDSGNNEARASAATTVALGTTSYSLKTKSVTKAFSTHRIESTTMRCTCSEDDPNGKGIIGCEKCNIGQHDIHVDDWEDEKLAPTSPSSQYNKPWNHKARLAAVAQRNIISDTRMPLRAGRIRRTGGLTRNGLRQKKTERSPPDAQHYLDLPDAPTVLLDPESAASFWQRLKEAWCDRKKPDKYKQPHRIHDYGREIAEEYPVGLTPFEARWERDRVAEARDLARALSTPASTS